SATTQSSCRWSDQFRSYNECVRALVLALLGVGLARTAQAEAPRLIAPLSGSRMTAQRPLLRWQGGGGAMRVELCRDRSCAQPIETIETRETRATPKAALPAGVVFWRVRAGAAQSPTWQVWIGRRSARVDG